MTHVHQDVARQRQLSMLATAVVQRDGRRASVHGRIARRAGRAERRAMIHADRAMNHADEAERLRDMLAEIESGA